jgi:hypothetical protein
MNRQGIPSIVGTRALSEADEALMRRFLVGEVTDHERDSVETRMFDDPQFFESLGALEHEMLVLLARHELPARWAEPLTAVVAASPDRQRHLDDVRKLLAEMPQSQPARQPMRRSVLSEWWLRAAAVAVIAVGTAGWWLRPASDRPLPDLSPADPVAATAPTFLLRPGPTRLPGQASNLIQLPPGSARISLVAVLDPTTAAVVNASMRPVGGEALVLPALTSLRRTTDGTEVTWEVPADAIAAGDYLITYHAAPADGAPADIGSRFVRIAK